MVLTVEMFGRCSMRRVNDTWYIHFDTLEDYREYVTAGYDAQRSWLSMLFERPNLESIQHYQQNSMGKFVEVQIWDRMLSEYGED